MLDAFKPIHPQLPFEKYRKIREIYEKETREKCTNISKKLVSNVTIHFYSVPGGTDLDSQRLF